MRYFNDNVAKLLVKQRKLLLYTFSVNKEWLSEIFGSIKKLIRHFWTHMTISQTLSFRWHPAFDDLINSVIRQKTFHNWVLINAIDKKDISSRELQKSTFFLFDTGKLMVVSLSSWGLILRVDFTFHNVFQLTSMRLSK
jgi:hypothetical protein